MITITGLNEITQKISNIKSKVNRKIPSALYKGLEGIRNDSVLYLDNVSFNPPGDDAIRDINNWNISSRGPLESSLICNSNHASIVEFGSLGVYPKNYLGTTIENTESKKKAISSIKRELLIAIY